MRVGNVKVTAFLANSVKNIYLKEINYLGRVSRQFLGS